MKHIDESIGFRKRGKLKEAIFKEYNYSGKAAS
jgi:hypothetical protein